MQNNCQTKEGNKIEMDVKTIKIAVKLHPQN